MDLTVFKLTLAVFAVPICERQQEFQGVMSDMLNLWSRISTEHWFSSVL